MRPHELRKQLKVRFLGEEGVDEGGVQREFFQLAMRELVDPKYGLFRWWEESRLYWFWPCLSNPDSGSNCNEDDASSDYELVGRLIGLAFYNGVILNVRFPRALYREMVGLSPRLAELAQLDPVSKELL